MDVSMGNCTCGCLLLVTLLLAMRTGVRREVAPVLRILEIIMSTKVMIIP